MGGERKGGEETKRGGEKTALGGMMLMRSKPPGPVKNGKGAARGKLGVGHQGRWGGGGSEQASCQGEGKLKEEV